MIFSVYYKQWNICKNEDLWLVNPILLNGEKSFWNLATVAEIQVLSKVLNFNWTNSRIHQNGRFTLTPTNIDNIYWKPIFKVHLCVRAHRCVSVCSDAGCTKWLKSIAVFMHILFKFRFSYWIKCMNDFGFSSDRILQYESGNIRRFDLLSSV